MSGTLHLSPRPLSRSRDSASQASRRRPPPAGGSEERNRPSRQYPSRQLCRGGRSPCTASSPRLSPEHCFEAVKTDSHHLLSPKPKQEVLCQSRARPLRQACRRSRLPSIL